MTEIGSIVSEAITRLLSEEVDRAVIDAAERGEWPAQLWRLVIENGFHHALSAQGGDAGWSDCFPILRAIGHHLAPIPLAETLIGNALLERSGLGGRAGPLSLVEQGIDSKFVLLPDGDAIVIDGTASAVPWGRHVKELVVSGRCGDKAVLAMVSMDADRIELNRHQTVSREPRDHVRFDRYRTTEYVACDDRLPPQPVLVFGALARSAMMIGAMEFLSALSIEYATVRTQFGRPIAKFQAVQHALASLASQVTAARAATLVAFEAADAAWMSSATALDVPAWDAMRFWTAVAKARSGQAAGLVSANAHQVHGAMGITYEHALQYGSRRLWSWRAEWGADRFWSAELGTLAIGGGGNAIWHKLTSVG